MVRFRNEVTDGYVKVLGTITFRLGEVRFRYNR